MDMRDTPGVTARIKGLEVRDTWPCYKHGGQLNGTDRMGRAVGAAVWEVVGPDHGGPQLGSTVSPGDLLEVWIIGSCPGPTESETLGVGFQWPVFEQAPRWIRCCCSVRTAVRPSGPSWRLWLLFWGEKTLEVWGQRSDVIWLKRKRKSHLYPGPILKDSNLISQR